MKVLFIQKVKGLAGSEKYFLELLPELKRKGIECQFLSVRLMQDGDKPLLFNRKLEELGIKVFDVKSNSDISFQLLNKIKTIIQSDNFDLVHTHLIHADFWVALIQLFFNVKIIQLSTKHGYDEKYIELHGFKGEKKIRDKYYYICKFSEKFIKKSFAVSKGLQDLFIDLTISKPDNISTIHHGFNYPAIDNRKEFITQKPIYQLIIVGRLIPFKGHKLLFEALSKVKNHIPNVNLFVLGSGECKESLEQLSLDLDIEENVSFIGFTEDVNEYLLKSDVMIVPSISEGFGLVFLEGMNAKLPIVAFDVSASNEIIKDNENGILVKPYDIEKLAEAIIYLFENPEKRQTYAINGYDKLISYFSLTRMVEDTISFYEKALV
ncbi:glycosyltransferase family 4 protein [Flammeovirga sp. SJP92]|uniref:glycosyltransferase family 4 protein n=1 Tax=Flammeovirga sp. SJP92 TaxID=1775430 RepID=UPI000788AC73|nr:glycosyltransferase family 4 protein [Flammeovirga sp. SJP92]KXX70407.1 hypothetical protein AVL50_09000 [Flammeovirga sp. SJP92]